MPRRCFARRARRGGAKRAVFLRPDAAASRCVRPRLRLVALDACRLGAALGGDGHLRRMRSDDGCRRCVRCAGADHPDRGVPRHRLGWHCGASVHGRRAGARCGNGVRGDRRRGLRACEPSVRTRRGAPCRTRGTCVAWRRSRLQAASPAPCGMLACYALAAAVSWRAWLPGS